MSSNEKLKELEVELKKIHSSCLNWAKSCVNWKEEIAEEVLQESYLKAIKNYDKFDGKASVKTWIFVIIRNTAIDYFRKKGDFAEYQDEVCYHEVSYFQTATQERRFKEKKDREKLEEVIGQLSKREREVIQLVYLQELTLREAAEIMKVSEGSVSTFYKRAKKKIKILALRPEMAENADKEFQTAWTYGFEKFSGKKAA